MFLGLFKKDQGHHTQQLGPVVDSDTSHHTGNPQCDVLTFLPTSFLMNPVIGSPVTIPVVLLGVHTTTHSVVSRLPPLPGAGVHDPTMTECLVSVAQLDSLPSHLQITTRLSY